MNRFLSLAIKLAKANPEPKWKLAAVTTSGGRILSVGLNVFMQNESPPGTIPHGCLGRHAEREALRFCNTVPRTIYVARVSKNFETRLARPCMECYTAILNKGVRRIVYTTPYGWGKETVGASSWTGQSGKLKQPVGE
jgi:deoxycytidylate deaminase